MNLRSKNSPQVEELKLYIKDLLEYLDGRGIILEDETLVDDALESLGTFSRLAEIFVLYSPFEQEEIGENLDD